MQKKQPDSFYKYTTMTTKMIVVILLLTYAGYKLDEYSSLSFSLFTLLGALLGSGLAIYLMIRDLFK